MKLSINWKLLGLLIGICVLIGVVYPMALWLFLDIGLRIGLGIGRVYAIWTGIVLLLATIGYAIYLLQPAEEAKVRPQMWRQS